MISKTGRNSIGRHSSSSSPWRLFLAICPSFFPSFQMAQQWISFQSWKWFPSPPLPPKRRFKAVSERFQSGLGARESGRGGRWKKWRSNPIRLESVSHTALLGRSTALSPYQLLIYTVTSSTLDFQSNNEEKHGQFNRNNSQKSQNIPHFSLSLPLQKNKIK